MPSQFTTLDVLPVGLLLLDEKRNIRYANPHFCTTFGCDSQAVTGKDIESLISRRYKQDLIAYHQRLGGHKEGVLDLEATLCITESDVPGRIRMRKDGNGWTAVVENMGQEQQRILELSNARRRLETIITYLGDGVLILDAENKIRECNNTAFELLDLRSSRGVKMTVEALIGRSLLDFLDRGQFDGFETALIEGKTDRDARFSASYQVGDRHLLWSVNPVHVVRRGFIGTCVTIRDISTERRAEMALADMVHELESARDAAMDATNAKSRFLTNMSHELRTPLNAIIGITELVEEEIEAETDPKKLMDPLSRIAQAGRHLLLLINDLLDLSKIEAGKMELQEEELDVETMVTEAAATAEPLTERNGNQLIVVCAPEVGVMHGDRTRINQILFNLLSNATKFTNNGKIRFESTRQEINGCDCLVFAISDDGVGMTEEEQGKLFDEFWQGNEPSRSMDEGSGLGLTITHRLCHLMGGDITVESSPGAGTTFRVCLPARMPG